MRLGRMMGVSAIALAGAWCTGANAQSDPGNGTIHLHLPRQTIRLHPIRHRAFKPATPAQTDEIGAEPTAAPERSAATPPAPEPAAPPAPAKSVRSKRASGHPAIPFNFGDEAASPAGGPPADLPPQETASIPNRPAAAAHASPAATAHAGLTKRGAVMFSKGAPEPSATQLNGVKLLAGDLSTTLESGGARVELDAYGGAPGDKSSDARRLSLRRALSVRQLLIDDGVPSSRIDVRAMGGADDKGPADRVDVFVRTG